MPKPNLRVLVNQAIADGQQGTCVPRLFIPVTKPKTKQVQSKHLAWSVVLSAKKKFFSR